MRVIINVVFLIFSGVCNSKIIQQSIVENRCTPPKLQQNVIERRGRVFVIRGLPHFSVKVTSSSGVKESTRVNVFSGKPIEQIFIQARTSSSGSSALVGSWSDRNLPQGHDIVLCGNVEASTVARTTIRPSFKTSTLEWLGECSKDTYFHVYAMVQQKWHKITTACVQHQLLKDTQVKTTVKVTPTEPKQRSSLAINCVDRYQACQTKWKRRGFCQNNFKNWAQKYCPVACNICTPPSKEDSCEDDPKYVLSCIRWSEKNRCFSGDWTTFVQRRCPKSCDLCRKDKTNLP